jgi:vacuolar-type H+-ATPase subunit I/STV1
MEIQPYVGEVALSASSVVVRVNPDDRKRAAELVARTTKLQVVNDEATFQTGTQLASQIKALINEMESSKKSAKQPFRAVETAIDQLLVEVGGPVVKEGTRLLGLLNGYVAELERKRKEEERRKAEVQRLKDAEMERKLKEATDKLAAAEAEARATKDEAARLLAQKNAAEKLVALAQAQLEREMADELSTIGANKPKPALVPGGRVDHPLKFELADVQATIRAGCWRLLKWSLDIRACQDSCRTQVEAAPNVEPTLPGIKVTREINVSVKASARTE